MKKITKVLLLPCLLLILIGCEQEEKFPFERITDNLGTAGGLRTIDLISPSIDLNNISESEFAVEVEVWDNEDGGLLESVDVFASFADNTPDNGSNDKEEALIKTIPSSAFTINSLSGLPRTIITATAPELNQILELDPANEIDGGDSFRIRLSLNLTDGGVFSSGNLEGNITGPFFNSPFSYPANVVCELDPSVFSGEYQMELVSGEFVAPFGNSPAYADGVVTITANSGTQRVVQNAVYIPSFGGGFPGPLTFDLICGRIIVPNQGAPASCVTSIFRESGTNVSTFDPSDDSEFLVIFNDELTSDCGVPTYEVILRFTKL
ncbi:hypothetical protein [uncultured Croceitalea sp.]|uniref:hypothetical protein n=1 Tax=uncultured Croceitalea sp. TaxID=1798908 RepID=UPI003305E9BF